MQLDAFFFAATIPAVLFAGLSKGGFGAGASFAATPFLALFLPVDVAVGLMLPLLMIMDVAGVGAFWRKWDWRNSRALMLAALPGIALGALLFRRADPDLVRLAIGLIALGFVGFQAARGLGWIGAEVRPFSLVSALIAGAVGGFTSFVSHAGSPPVAIHLLGQGIDKQRYQATTVLVFWWINLMKLPPYLGLGLIGSDSLRAILVLAPVAVAGTLLGVWAHDRIPQRPYFALIYLSLVATGIKLIWDALV
jgi:uncharacterized protein